MSWVTSERNKILEGRAGVRKHSGEGLGKNSQGAEGVHPFFFFFSILCFVVMTLADSGLLSRILYIRVERLCEIIKQSYLDLLKHSQLIWWEFISMNV